MIIDYNNKMENSESTNFFKSAFMGRVKPLRKEKYSAKIMPHEDGVFTPKTAPRRKHIKWAEELEEVKTFRKNPSDKRVALLQKRAKRTSKVCGDSILKRAAFDDDNSVTSDTEASSTWGDSECSTPLRLTVYRTSQKQRPDNNDFSSDVKNNSFTKSYRPEDKLIARLQKRYRMAMDF